EEQKDSEEENIQDFIYEKVKKNPEELSDIENLESNIQVLSSEEAMFALETAVENDIYIATEDVEYHVEIEGDSVILVGEYSDGTIQTTKEAIIYDDVLMEQLEQEEFKANYENALNFEYLVKKTDANYEVVQAYSDGSFSYIKSADTIEEAMNIALAEYKDDSAIPSVIDNYGVVVYSTNSMARFFKHTNGKVDNTNVTLLYQYANLTGVTNYTNHNYVDDAPVIEDNGNTVKVMVNGYKGWAKKDTKTGTYDVVIVPMNQATNPSYYTVSGGELKHYITTDITAVSGKSGSIRTVGVAPSYLKEGVKYYSYDARYFYTSLDTLINDMKANKYSNAVNGSNPYYNYYQYLPFRSKSVYTAAQLNSFINANTQSNSKLRGIGQYLINAQNNYGVNALTILGVAINESAWGLSSYAQNRNNLFGLNAVDSNPDDASRFNSVEQCINEFARYWISTGYSDPQDSRYYGGFLGNKYMGANVKYASDPFWGEKAASYAFTADKYLSGNKISSLKDYNYNQLAIYSAAGKVVDKNNKLLYNVSNLIDYNVTFVGVPVALTTTKTFKIGQDTCYEIYPERTTSLPA
nr:glucosaminidase domain-containing protein [Clostridium sp.]